MNPENHINENEQLENEEQAIGEPLNPTIVGVDFSNDLDALSKITISPEEDEQLTLEKRMAESDDMKNGELREYYGE